MTRKDFILIANVLKASKPDLKSGTVAEKRLWIKIVNDMGTALAGTNDYFDHDKFSQACGCEIGGSL